MTTTAAPAPAPLRTLRRPGPARRRRPLWILAAVAVLGIVLASTSGDSGRTVPIDDALAAEMNGIYILDDGAHLTVWGSPHHLFVELDGNVSGLSKGGEDRFLAFSGAEVLRVRRERGNVTGVDVEHAGAPVRTGSRVDLHVEEPVTFRSGDLHLAGTAFTPLGDGPHPAAVLVHGAEFTDRSTYWLLASHLARNGVAALIYDKRGTGKSSGSAKHATFSDLREDALAGVAAMRARADVRRDRVGVLGFSQGAWIVADAARHSRDIAFVIAYGASGFSPAEQQAWLHGNMLAARGFGTAAMRIADRVDRMLYSSIDLVDAGLIPPVPHIPGFWFHALDLHLNSAALWSGVRQPVLLAWGEMDCQVPAYDSLAALTSALRQGGNADVTTAVLSHADHSFTLVPPCGNETGLAHHGGHRLADGYLQLAPTWIGHLHSDASPLRQPAARQTPEAGPLGWRLKAPAPAPLHGSIGVQFAAVLGLLTLFSSLIWTAWRVRPRGTEPGRRTAWLLGATGAAGLFATVTVVAAFTEIAMLGATHAALLLGGPTVRSSSLLMRAAPTAVLVTVIVAMASVSLQVRAARRQRAEVPGLTAVAAVAAGALLAWASYWGLAPFS